MQVCLTIYEIRGCAFIRDIIAKVYCVCHGIGTPLLLQPILTVGQAKWSLFLYSNALKWVNEQEIASMRMSYLFDEPINDSNFPLSCERIPVPRMDDW